MMKDIPHDVRAVANYILDSAHSYRIENVTLMQLLKLVYLSHGWSLVFSNTPLVRQLPQAWQLGVVYPTIYKQLVSYANTPIGKRLIDNYTNLTFTTDMLTETQQKIIKAVCLSYGRMNAYDLSNIITKTGGPWEITIRKEGLYKEIPLTVMEEYFRTLAKERNLITV